MVKDFTDLLVWQKGHSLVVAIYKIVKVFPPYEQRGLADQMRRASVSVTSNIAEGFNRHGVKEKVQFYYLAAGSLTEIRNQIYIARDVGYILDQDSIGHLLNRTLEVEKMLFGLIRAARARI